MQDTLSISDQGLRLIKAFEGFRPVDRERVSGGRVVGYGHRVEGDRAVIMTESEASAQLRDDLAPFEDMLNERVYASVTQSQFDALASLAFNIGPKAFLESTVLKAVNSGRLLDAARGFDAWRLARVGGETYVIDALVRRRTAEKSLFLRPPEGALAPKAPTPDLDVREDDTPEDPQPTLDRDGAGRLVADAPYDIERLITAMPARRVEDGPAGDMADSEYRSPAAPREMPLSTPTSPTLFAGLDSLLDPQAEPDDDNVLDLGEYAQTDDVSDAPVEDPADADLSASGVEAPIRTAIADAADEVRDRLEALMVPDAPEATTDREDADWPDSLVGELEPLELADIAIAEDSPEPVSDVEFDDASPRSADVVAFPASVATPPPPVSDEVPQPPEPNEARTPEAAPVLDEGEPIRVRRRLSRRLRGPEVAPEADDLPSEDVWVPPAPEPIPVRPRRDVPWPYLVFLVIGGAMFGVGAALRLRGVDRVFGFDAQLASVALLMVGALVLLGGLLYLVKALLNLSNG